MSATTQAGNGPSSRTSWLHVGCDGDSTRSIGVAPCFSIVGSSLATLRTAWSARYSAVELECAYLPPEPFARETAIARLLLGPEPTALMVTFIRREAVEIPAPAEAVSVLDAVLRAAAGA
jgi:hypothetical protein